MRIEFMGPQFENAHMIGLPFAAVWQEVQEEGGREGFVFAFSILFFQFAWFIVKETP